MRAVGVPQLLAATVTLSLALPLAMAAQSTGELALVRALNLPPGSEIALAPQGLYLEGTDGASGITLEAATSARICFGEKHYKTSGGINLRDPTQGTWRCTMESMVSLQILDRGNQSGWLALYPGIGTVTAEASSSNTIRRPATTTLASPDARNGVTTTGNPEEIPQYYERFDAPHMRVESAGALTYVGQGLVKFRGPDLRLETSRGVTEYYTGDSEEAAGPLGAVVQRWLTIEFADATFAIITSKPAQIVSSEAAALRWDGDASFVSSGGTLFTSSAEYRAQGLDEQHLDGVFSGTLSLGAAPGEFRLSLNGEMRSTTLQRLPIPIAERVWLPNASLLAVGLAVAGAGVTGYLVRQRSRAASRPLPKPVASEPARGPEVVRHLAVAFAAGPGGPDSYAARAEEAADRAATPADWLRAADLFAKARIENTDESKRLRLAGHHAMCLLQAGELRRAMSVFDEAAKSDLTGDFDRWATICALRLHEPDAAEFFLARGLDRPHMGREILDQIEEYPAFHELLRRPSIAAALEAARQRFAREDSP